MHRLKTSQSPRRGIGALAAAGQAMANGGKGVYTLTNQAAGNAVAVFDRAGTAR